MFVHLFYQYIHVFISLFKGIARQEVSPTNVYKSVGREDLRTDRMTCSLISEYHITSLTEKPRHKLNVQREIFDYFPIFKPGESSYAKLFV